MAEVRRSSRARKSANSFYEEAKEELERVSPASKNKHKTAAISDEEERSVAADNNTDDDDDERNNSSDSSSSSDDDSEAAAAPVSRRKKKSPLKIHVQYQKKKAPAANKKKQQNQPKAKAKKAPPKSRALEALKRKVLDTNETPENSLVAAILEACTSSKKAAATTTESSNNTRYPDAFCPSPYTAALEPLAKAVLQQYQNDANQAHVMLLNLVFRSVGGSYSTALSSDKDKCRNLDDMDDDQWEQVVTSIVDDMRLTPPDSILFCSCPKGALFVNTNDHNKHSVAQEEYRQIYEHFWYLLGTLGLSTSGGGSSNHASTTFDIERIRDVALRMMELVTVGQPDLRAAATVAALQLSCAACDGTLEFQTRLATANRQLQSAKAAKTSTKQQALATTVDKLQRSGDDLQQVIMDTIVPGVFMRRYRDSDPYIRASCLQALSSMTLQRPDLFLTDTYLKYFGWMMSDKHADVRVVAIRGLLAPFVRAQEQEESSAHVHPLSKINLSNMEHVIGKFLPRIADCVLDVSVEVQEQAMALLLVLLREGFMDDVDNDTVWNQINLRSLAPDTTAKVRRDALYFVLEQLEPFDDVVVKNVSLERQRVDRIVSIATWVAHLLSDSQVPAIPLDKLRINLTDFVVQSLRDMPEHSSLITDWTALLMAIKLDTKSSQSELRSSIAKQRILLRMLTTAAALEVGSLHAKHEDDDDDDSVIIDPVLVKVKHQIQPAAPAAESSAKKSKKKTSSSLPQESLTVGLLKALPELLKAFKGDIEVLRGLTTLPQYFVHSVLSLPQRKKDVQALIEILSELFLDSTDTTVLQNTCIAVTALASGDHSRNREALLELKNMATTVRDRLLHLYATVKEGNSVVESPNKRRRSSRSPQKSNDSQEDDALDQEHAISLCLRRLRLISKRWYLGDLLQSGSASTPSSQDDSTEVLEDPSVSLCSVIAKMIHKDLKAREITLPEDDESSIEIPKIWSEADPHIHQEVANTVADGLNTILSVTAWKMKRAYEKEEEAIEQQKDSDEESKDSEGSGDEDNQTELDAATTAELETEAKTVIRMRDGLCKLMGVCFDQYVEMSEEDVHKEQIAFATQLQIEATRVSADLRSLFPKEWAESISPVLRSTCLLDDGHLIGGHVRFFRSKEDDLTESNRDKEFTDSYLLPLGRGLVANWTNGNRREAGVALSHISNSGERSAKTVASLARVLKKIEPVRVLESMMASLRQSYADWMDSEPEEPESDRPTEEELEGYEQAEQAHAESFKALEHKASRLASSLGVGKLSDDKLQLALFGFIREGIRFAFSNEDPGSEEDLLVGSRLSFLLLLMKYLTWVKRKKSQLKQLKEDCLQCEANIRASEDWEEVRDEDLEALNKFRKALGFKDEIKKHSQDPATPSTPVASDDEEDLHHSQSSRKSTNRRLSVASSVSSMRSKRSNLSPLMEDSDAEENEDAEDEPEPPKKKRGRPSVAATIKEATDEEEDSDDSSA